MSVEIFRIKFLGPEANANLSKRFLYTTNSRFVLRFVLKGLLFVSFFPEIPFEKKSWQRPAKFSIKFVAPST